VCAGFACITTVLNLDNGRRTTAGARSSCCGLLGFAQQSGLTLRLAYYPPYHSRVQCGGTLLGDPGAIEWQLARFAGAVVKFAASTYDLEGRHPVVKGRHDLLDGVKLAKLGDAAGQHLEASGRPRQMVRRHCWFRRPLSGYIIVLESLIILGEIAWAVGLKYTKGYLTVPISPQSEQ